MAQEIKNTFLKSKMNKDLDDRILPNGEYRDARNISVGRSEDNDVGALENIIGNNLITSTDIGDGLTIIGIKENNSTDELFVFLTDYTDPNPLEPTDAPSTSRHYIYSYNNSTQIYSRLVQGYFLNFSTTNRIIGINLIESLLFWTDNRNQPRKINSGISISGNSKRSSQDYYTQEHQISVAKYSPYQAIKLYTRLDVDITNGSVAYINVSGDRVAEITPFIGATVVSSENLISGNEHIKIINVALVGSATRISLSPNIPVPLPNTYFSFIMSTMTNKNDDTDWPGDPDFLEDKFVRFSYRFKYDDNEYSLMAPFTQIAYIPKQYGFFLSGDENSAYQSTVVDFMENLVQNIGLVIPLPTNANRLVRDYKISEMEILFRESDGVAVKVLESITAGQISGASGVSNFFTYDYQSRKPYRTLPEAQTIRVYDKVPVTAFSQESSGNRIIYGNYKDQHTPPANLNYNCRISFKSDTGKFNNWIEYPNHSVKRNRNYQVGFILADKFGRQSPVILSSVDTGANSDGKFYFGSTIYSAYDIGNEDTSVLDWFGDSIMVLVNSEVASIKNSATGTPGLYAIKQNATNPNAEGYAIKRSGSVIVDDSTYTFRLDNINFPNNINIPIIGDSLRGAYEDFVFVTNIEGPTGAQLQYTVTTSGRVNDVYLREADIVTGGGIPDLKFAYTINDLGWYSYKIVVKQTEQEYYNVYLPGMLNGYPGQSGSLGDASNVPDPIPPTPGGIDNGLFPTNETNKTAFTVLFNDNINKIPRDLQEVGDQDLQYRSSVTLYGRVTNTMTIDPSGSPYTNSIPSNSQYYARLDYEGKTAISHTSTAIARAKEVNMGSADLTDVPLLYSEQAYKGANVFYQLETNPLIARISTTEKSIGATALWGPTPSGGTAPVNIPDGANNMLPFLSIYETQAVNSLLDLYWETASEGLIVDLNADVLSGAGGATSFVNVTWDFDETTLPNTIVTGVFEPVNSEAEVYQVPTTATLESQTDGNGENVELFELRSFTSGSNQGKYQIAFKGDDNGDSLVFDASSRALDVYSFVIAVTTSDDITTEIPLTGQIGGFGALKNIAPSFSTLPNSAVTNTTSVIYPAANWTNTVNGTASDFDGAKTIGLQFSMEWLGAPELNPIDLYGWEMDASNGQITQPVPPDDNTPNPNGTWEIRLTMQDAFDVGSPTGDYSWLFDFQNVTITLGYPAVNPLALSNICVLSTPMGPYFNGLLTNASSKPTVAEYQGITVPVSDEAFPLGPPGTPRADYNSQGFTTSSTGLWFIGNQDLELINTDNLDGYWPPEYDDVRNDQAGTEPTFGGSTGTGIFPNEGAAGTPYQSYNKKYQIGGNVAGPFSAQAHRSGTIMFTINVFASNVPFSDVAVGTLQPISVFIYYRKAQATGDVDPWTEIPNSGALEYNNVRLRPNFGDWPPYVNGYKYDGDEKTFVQYVRAFNKSDFDTPGSTEDIEYAIIVKGLEFVGGTGSGIHHPIAWVTADDVHYPKCLNWQGTNAALTSTNTRAGATPGVAGSGSFKYEASAGSNNSETFDSNFTQTLYADNPYGDYVNNFYTDVGLTTVWEPNEGEQFINYRLVQSEFNTTLPNWIVQRGGGSGEDSIEMQWISEFQIPGGEKAARSEGTVSKSFLVGAYTGGPGTVIFPATAVFGTTRLFIKTNI